MKNNAAEKTKVIPRRDFLKTSATAGLTAALAGRERLFAQGSDKLRVGVIGCGWRGTEAAEDCVTSSENVEVVAMADLFQDQLDSSLAKLSRKVDDKVTVTEETTFVGFDAYQKLLACDIDLVILATDGHDGQERKP